MAERRGHGGRSIARPRGGWPRGRYGRAGTKGGAPSDHAWTLTASEIGTFAFCPHAWYLQRRGLPVTPEAAARRRAGERDHRIIGRRTDALRAAGHARRLLLAAIVLLAAAILLLGLRGAG